ncbi:MAG: sensor histidine kinase [Lentisphaerae bacterium]|nr:sensor histidine kinase [Lentisphaerota bacterium]MBT4817762.1 sensor histidine kinase [Lentisphaerota bacterium]MBT5610865.1 sensor histidine kinase [Lentisphaerota bacterium]MBT7053703.1 sensor histidine kinase [Lentisphaerota bacterium]MBT7841164.1 sensor histidine kinase [Lentisphaerota bacterium]
MSHNRTEKHNGSTRLRVHVLAWTTACAMIPLIAMALQGYHCARQAIIDLETTHLRSVLEGRRARISDWVEERKQDVRAVAAYPHVWRQTVQGTLPGRNAAAGDLADFLENVRTSNRSVDSITIYDKSWRQVAGSAPTVGDPKDALSPAFRDRLKAALDVVVGSPQTDASERIGIRLGAPLVNPGGNRVGSVVTNVLLSDTLYPILEDHSGLRATTKTYIVSNDGRFFSGPRPHIEVLSRGTRHPAGFLDGCSSEAESYQDCCGKPVLAMASPMPDLGWILVAEVDQIEAFAWLSALRRRAATAAAVVFVAVLILGSGGARRVAQPFHELRAVARRVAAGNHGERVSMLGSAEAQEVGHAVNTMLDELEAFAQKLANAGALAAVGQLSSSVVHEMRNPLSSIKLNLGAVREAFEEGSDDRELADIALREATRVEKMLNDLLAFGKPLELSLLPVSLRALLERCLEHANSVSRTRGIEVRINWNELRESALVCDEEQMLRALCNLVDNAVSFSPDGGEIQLAASIPPGAPSALEISVRDQGPGIPTEHLGSVFEPFFTTRERGTGLGLANVAKIATCHNGTVRAANHEEGGAQFVIRLPTARRDSE